MCVFFSITMRIEQDTSSWCNWKLRLMRICARSAPNNRCHFHRMYPQISTLQAACGWFTDRFRCAVTKVSFFCRLLAQIFSLILYWVTSLLETRASVKRGVGAAVWHGSRCVLPSAHLSPVVWPAGLLQLRGVHRGGRPAAPVYSILQGKNITL